MDLNVVYNDSLFRIVLMLTFSLQSLRLKRMMSLVIQMKAFSTLIVGYFTNPTVAPSRTCMVQIRHHAFFSFHYEK